MTETSLLDRDDSVLIAIDIQPPFVKKESEDGSKALLQRMCWVIKVVNWLNARLIFAADGLIPG